MAQRADGLVQPRLHALPERRAGGGQGRGAHLPAQCRTQGAGRRLLDELLVPPLDGALAVSELDYVSVGVREDLKFDVSGVLDLLFEVELPVPEAGDRLGARASSKSSGSSSGPLTRRIPSPPPPAEALIRTGQPTRKTLILTTVQRSVKD